MKKTLFVVSLLFPLTTFANDPCIPNLIKEDMCVAAEKIASGVKKSIPIKITDSMKITDVTSEKRRVIMIMSLSYNMNGLTAIANGDNKLLRDIRDFHNKASIQTACGNKYIRSFINLGGEVEYKFTFKDKSIYDVVTITSCY
ncbi:hypothetical protein I5E97_14275 [Proteus hauseri]|nr:hypothetical protein [Proteus hauseri]MBG6032199.1 hypothetical protein [Proteus hauseri]